MITTYGINSIANYIQQNVAYCQYVINGATQRIDIRRVENTGSKVRIFVYFNSSVANGTITKAQLIDLSGNVFAEKVDIMSKADKKGLMIVFDFTISEVM